MTEQIIKSIKRKILIPVTILYVSACAVFCYSLLTYYSKASKLKEQIEQQHEEKIGLLKEIYDKVKQYKTDNDSKLHEGGLSSLLENTAS